ncbi:MAG: radical SAM protein [Clostridia bacterium]|nr:radical SAM protein [Clostridia bacterium]
MCCDQNQKTVICTYVNGNYTVTLYSDGTKQKVTNEDKFIAAFPDSIDLKITNRCDLGCPMCHESSTPNGKHANLLHPILNQLPAGIELAIGGGNPLCHPDLVPFLQRMKKQGVICNITVNEKHLEVYYDKIVSLINDKLVHGVGVSINKCSQFALDFLKEQPNAVAHVICGIVSHPTLKKLQDCKVLFLGYKIKGRGKNNLNPDLVNNLLWLKKKISRYLYSFNTVCFDNLAIRQLKINEIIDKEQFDNLFMGNDGEGSMYINLVEKSYSVSSTSANTYPLKDDIYKTFAHVKSCAE